jgi:uroporphyrinogen-III synthase
MAPLQGVGVLVTRPEQQAMSLCRMLEAQGARPTCLPVIDIEATQPQATLSLELGAPERFDLIIFTSANAVRFGALLLGAVRALSLAAIGPATARALERAGHRVALQGADGADSEALLRHPRLSQLKGSRVLIVKGEGGRTLLREELRRRGAEVQALEVYRRVPVRHAPAALGAVQARFAAGEVQVVTATSLDIGERLLALQALAGELRAAAWLVPSLRVGAALQARGFGGRLIVAASAEDQDLVSALVGWRRASAGA